MDAGRRSRLPGVDHSDHALLRDRAATRAVIRPSAGLGKLWRPAMIHGGSQLASTAGDERAWCRRAAACRSGDGATGAVAGAAAVVLENLRSARVVVRGRSAWADLVGPAHAARFRELALAQPRGPRPPPSAPASTTGSPAAGTSCSERRAGLCSTANAAGPGRMRARRCRATGGCGAERGTCSRLSGRGRSSPATLGADDRGSCGRRRSTSRLANHTIRNQGACVPCRSSARTHPALPVAPGARGSSCRRPR
jgi:hypothetical protein